MADGKPDIVVWSEKRGWYAKELPYGSNVGAPAIRPITHLSAWAAEGVLKTQHYFQTELDELQTRYDALQKEWNWNERIYSCDYRFEPVVGKLYYLYESNSGEFLSMISPKEWKQKFIGATKLNNDRRWEFVEIE